mgnify:CR=1 FL=1
MFRVVKPLNNNGLLALTGEGREVILLGKGIGFGRKNGERIERLPGAKVYTLVPDGKRSALQAINSINPQAVELAARILEEAGWFSLLSQMISCCRWPITLHGTRAQASRHTSAQSAAA